MPYRREFEQGSAAWLAWRRDGVGASDAPVIMGVSPWTDLEELRREKGGPPEDRPPNWAMRRGTRLEPEARALYVRRTDIRVTPLCLEHGTRRWMRASLDGISDDGRVLLEVKCPGAVDHARARSGRVPDKYVPQLQHLLEVSGAEVCHYWSFREGEGVLVEVAPEPAYIAGLVEREDGFWRLVLEDRRSPARIRG
jgi:putative phage-type endonuclease